jgi:hypothetical protein
MEMVRRHLINIGVLISTLLLTLGVVEILLRNFMPIDYRPPPSELPNVSRQVIYQASELPGLDYELVPNVEIEAHGTIVKTNRYGMRSDEPSPDSDKRFVVLGDSFTFGFGVPQNEIFPTRLAKALRKNGQEYDVLNLAVAGYAMKDELLIYGMNGQIILISISTNRSRTRVGQMVLLSSTCETISLNIRRKI